MTDVEQRKSVFWAYLTLACVQFDLQDILAGDPISLTDFEAALQSTKPSANVLTKKYEGWSREHGAAV